VSLCPVRWHEYVTDRQLAGQTFLKRQFLNSMIPGFRFHHIGVSCRNIDKEIRSFALLGYELEGERFSDPLQKIHGCFLVGPGPKLELLAPMDDSSPLLTWLQKGSKMYHQAYEVDAIEPALATMSKARAVIVSRPKPSVAFGGHKIAFLMLPNHLLLELIES